jgi:hypothetical protein
MFPRFFRSQSEPWNSPALDYTLIFPRTFEDMPARPWARLSDCPIRPQAAKRGFGPTEADSAAPE